MSNQRKFKDEVVPEVVPFPDPLVCTQCGKTITNDGSLPIKEAAGNLFLGTHPAVNSSEDQLIICGECADGIVMLHFAGLGYFRGPADS